MGLFQQDLPVPLHVDDVGMVVGHMDHSLVVPRPACQPDVQHPGRRRAVDADVRAVQVCLNGCGVLLRHMGNDLKPGLRIPGHHAHGDSRRQAPAAPGIGHHNGLDVFQDVSADLRQNAPGPLPQHLAQPCRAVGHGDGLGASGGQLQFLTQNGTEGLLFSRVQHDSFPFHPIFFPAERRCMAPLTPGARRPRCRSSPARPPPGTPWAYGGSPPAPGPR